MSYSAQIFRALRTLHIELERWGILKIFPCKCWHVLCVPLFIKERFVQNSKFKKKSEVSQNVVVAKNPKMTRNCVTTAKKREKCVVSQLYAIKFAKTSTLWFLRPGISRDTQNKIFHIEILKITHTHRLTQQKILKWLWMTTCIKREKCVASR